MGVCSYGFFNKKVNVLDIGKVILLKWDNNAKISNHAGSDGVVGTIQFRYPSETGIEERILWVFFRKENSKGMQDYEVKELHTYINFNKWGHSEEIIKELLSAFGGGIFVPKDEDMDEYEIIQGDGEYVNGVFENCRIITYDDIIKQFGENIIIDITSIKNNGKVRLV